VGHSQRGTSLSRLPAEIVDQVAVAVRDEAFGPCFRKWDGYIDCVMGRTADANFDSTVQSPEIWIQWQQEQYKRWTGNRVTLRALADLVLNLDNRFELCKKAWIP